MSTSLQTADSQYTDKYAGIGNMSMPGIWIENPLIPAPPVLNQGTDILRTAPDAVADFLKSQDVAVQMNDHVRYCSGAVAPVSLMTDR